MKFIAALLLVAASLSAQVSQPASYVGGTLVGSLSQITSANCSPGQFAYAWDQPAGQDVLVCSGAAGGSTSSTWAVIGSGPAGGALNGTYPNAVNLNAPQVFYQGVAITAPGTTGLQVPIAYAVCISTCTVTPPPPAAGLYFCARNAPTYTTVITMHALGAGKFYELTNRTNYATANQKLVSGGAATDQICLLGLDANHYLTLSSTGTWTDTP